MLNVVENVWRSHHRCDQSRTKRELSRVRIPLCIYDKYASIRRGPRLQLDRKHGVLKAALGPPDNPARPRHFQRRSGFNPR
jgi:hypothetical protein